MEAGGLSPRVELTHQSGDRPQIFPPRVRFQKCLLRNDMEVLVSDM